MFSRQAVTLTSRLVSLWFFYYAGLMCFEIYRWYLLQSNPARFDSRAIAITYGTGVSFFGQLLAQLILGVFFFQVGPKAVRFLFGETIELSAESQEMANDL